MPHVPGLLLILAGERIRVAFQLIQLVESDLANPEIKFQAGQLIQFQEALKRLSNQLDGAVGKG